MADVPAQIGPYQLAREIGRGGMGVVYQGRDPRLDRDVAIKALPEEWAEDPGRLARFEREAKALAQLSHPNIAGIHGVEEQDGRRFLVLEYIEGDTLADRLDAGAIPLDEALELAVGIASGVEAAHEAGVVHRDLKPDNIKITPEGQVKVLDFGLAKAEDGVSSTTGDEPTVAGARSPTAPGAILGTAPYMSPEQARGRKVDKRTDIWSFGAVLYEMLTGACPFIGETPTDSIGAVLHKDVDLDRLPKATPALVRHVLVRCLERDRHRRYRDLGDVRIELEAARSGAAGVHPGPDDRPGRGTRVVATAALVAAVAVLTGALVWWLAGRDKPEPSRRFVVDLLPGAELDVGSSADFALSPDGARLAIAATLDGVRSLWTRAIESEEPIRLPGTDGASDPVFSPDGEWIAYLNDDALWKVAITGGSPFRICDADRSHRGVAWQDEDWLILAPSTTSPLLRVDSAGGAPEAITSLTGPDGGRADRSHRWPAVTPDGRFIAYVSQKQGESFSDCAINLLDTESGRDTVLVQGGSYPIIMDDGVLVFVRDATAFVVRIDWSAGAPIGRPRPVLNEVAFSSANGGAQLAVSRRGLLVYIEGGSVDRLVAVPTWVSLADGSRTPIMDEAVPLDAPRISPDGTRVAFHTVTLGDREVVVHELARGIETRIPTAGDARKPIWSPDGRQLVFSMPVEESLSPILHVTSSDGEGAPSRLMEPSFQWNYAHDWTPHGSRLCFLRSTDRGLNDLLLMHLERDEPRSETLVSGSDASRARFSPDGNWVAYDSPVSGTHEVYVRRIDGPSHRRQVSVGGGRTPFWSPDGSAVYYSRYRGRIGTELDTLMKVELTPTGEMLEPGMPERVIDYEVYGFGGPYARIDLHPDGTRLLVMQPAADQDPDLEGRTHLVTSWMDDVERVLSGSGAGR